MTDDQKQTILDWVQKAPEVTSEWQAMAAATGWAKITMIAGFITTIYGILQPALPHSQTIMALGAVMAVIGQIAHCNASNTYTTVRTQLKQVAGQVVATYSIAAAAADANQPAAPAAGTVNVAKLPGA